MTSDPPWLRCGYTNVTIIAPVCHHGHPVEPPSHIRHTLHSILIVNPLSGDCDIWLCLANISSPRFSLSLCLLCQTQRNLINVMSVLLLVHTNVITKPTAEYTFCQNLADQSILLMEKLCLFKKIHHKIQLSRH